MLLLLSGWGGVGKVWGCNAQAARMDLEPCQVADFTTTGLNIVLLLGLNRE